MHGTISKTHSEIGTNDASGSNGTNGAISARGAAGLDCVPPFFYTYQYMKAKLTMYKHIGKLCEPNNGYIKEFNLVSWNNREPVYDIRTWNENHTEWKEGAVITHNEMFKFQKLLTDYLNSENKYKKSVPANKNTEQEEDLREIYIRFASKLKNGFFDKSLYNIFFEKLNERFKQWKKNGAVPMRAFEVCIDCIYVLSKNAPKLSEKDLEKSKAAKDEIYGLLMGFE